MSQSLPMPAVSVLMPVFNAERYLAEALDSILSQTFPGFEIVVVDDGSTDASATIVADYAARDKRIRILRQQNSGIVAALNRGLQECRAPLVARMDADDICLPNRLAAQVSYFESHPDVAALGTAFQLISEAGSPGPVIRHPATSQAIKQGLRRESVLAHPTVMMRRDAVLAAGGYREPLRHAEDYDLWTRLADRHALANLDDCLVLYRIHAQQVSWARSEAQALASIMVQRLARDRLRTGKEQTPLPAAPDQADLASLGIAAADLEDLVVANAVGRISAYESVGMSDAASALRSTLLHAAQSPDRRSMRRSLTARLAWSDFKVAAERRHWLAATRALASCARAIAADARLRRAFVRRVLALATSFTMSFSLIP